MAEKSRFRGLSLFSDQRPCLDWSGSMGWHLHFLTPLGKNAPRVGKAVFGIALAISFCLCSTNLFSQAPVKVQRPELSIPDLRFSDHRMKDVREKSPEKRYFPAAQSPVLKPGLLPHANAAFFCRMEASLDKKVKIPLRFRLGSLDYVNSLERKPGY
jgi:hypothetical protein